MPGAKLALGALVASATVAATLALSACSSRQALCAPLHENITLVANGEQARSSDSYSMHVGRRRAHAEITRGDFRGSWSVEQIRDCLGPEWTETHSVVDGAARGESWVFARSGFPMVMYVQTHNARARDLEARVVIEPLRVASPDDG